ncbi:MAG: beta-ketoacyl-ACP synthase II [Oscillospiraceae bacterium]|nr:beta-ketoacyl-ACP synthase II [Oscillospiraceae bacterium]
MRRVVITGIGVVSPVGIGKESYWKSISQGKSGIAPITRFDTAEFKANLAAEVKDFNAVDFMDKKESRRSDLYCQYALAAAKMAAEDGNAGDFSGFDKSRVGVIIGSGIGGIETFETEHTKLMEKGPGKVSPLFIPMMISNMASGMVSIAYGIGGVSFCPVTACAAASHAIGEVYRYIKDGSLDAALCGGAEAAITPISVAGFANMTALCEQDDPNAASLPFDKRRNGFVIGEGAAVLLVESYDSAVKRGVPVYCEVLGYGASSDAYHMTGPDPEGKGAAAAMKLALGNTLPGEVDYINAHGTGTPLNDPMEVRAVKAVFGSAPPPISSTKSMTGHLLGAAGGIEAAACALAIKHGLLPPTINYKEPDDECDVDVVPNQARPCNVRRAMSNSLGFGGHNASLLFGYI